MIHLEMTPQTSTIRVYDEPGGYEKRIPYVGIVTVTHLTDKEVYLHGAHGKVDRETLDKVLALLQERGVATVKLERRGRMKTIELLAQAASGQTNNRGPHERSKRQL